MVLKLYYKTTKENKFSGPLLKDKIGFSHMEWDLHLVCLPVCPGLLDTMEGARLAF